MQNLSKSNKTTNCKVCLGKIIIGGCESFLEALIYKDELFYPYFTHQGLIFIKFVDRGAANFRVSNSFVMQIIKLSK